MSISGIYEIAGTLLVHVGGPTVLAGGILAWLGRAYLVRMKGGIDKTIESMRAEVARELQEHDVHLGHRSYVTRSQYDLEVQAYREIWARLVVLGDVTGRLGASVEEYKGSKDQKRMMSTFKEHEMATRSFQDIFFQHRPFVPESVFVKIAELQGFMFRETARVLCDPECEDFDPAPISERITDICTSIRERLSSVKLLDA